MVTLNCYVHHPDLLHSRVGNRYFGMHGIVFSHTLIVLYEKKIQVGRMLVYYGALGGINIC